jgi:hypothetical protein
MPAGIAAARGAIATARNRSTTRKEKRMSKYPNSLLGIYATVLTVAFGGLLLMGARAPGAADFDTINVHRINVREPDGTLRMVISDRSAFPGLIAHGKEYPHPRPRAGMLFYDDEGTEQGGLVFSGRKGADGKGDSGLSLTFDRYDQDQQLQLIGLDEHGHAFAGMAVNDVPTVPTQQQFEEREKLAAMPDGPAKTQTEARLREAGAIMPRYFAGKSRDGNSVVMLQDATGAPRLALMVTPDGKASIDFLDADGKVQRTLTAVDAEAGKP